MHFWITDIGSGGVLGSVTILGGTGGAGAASAAADGGAGGDGGTIVVSDISDDITGTLSIT